MKTSNIDPKFREKLRKASSMSGKHVHIPVNNPLHTAEQEVLGGWWLTEDAVVVDLKNHTNVEPPAEEDEVSRQLRHERAQASEPPLEKRPAASEAHNPHKPSPEEGVSDWR